MCLYAAYFFYITLFSTTYTWVLTIHQRTRFDAIIGSFPSFESKDVVDVGENKSIMQRHFSASLVIKKLLYEKIGFGSYQGIAKRMVFHGHSCVFLAYTEGK